MTTNVGSLETYAFNRASAILNHNEREIGRVFCGYKDNLVIIDGWWEQEHEYLIPKTKVHHYGDNQIHFNISQNTERLRDLIDLTDPTAIRHWNCESNNYI